MSSISIFFHHIDGYFMNNLKKRLMKENFNRGYIRYEIVCTIRDQKSIFKVMHGQHPIEVLNQSHENFMEKVLECDILIFKILTEDFENLCVFIRQVFTGLEKWANEQKKAENPTAKKHVIVVSSPMTWALTMPNNLPDQEEAGEEGSEVDGYLFEDDYRRRKAHPNYCKYKILERDTIWLQKRCKNFVKTLVVCPGIAYGKKNRTFHYMFKLSYYNKRVPIIRPGTQLIPMIYILDLVEMMKMVIDNFPDAKHRYIFMVQPTLIPIKRFTYNICRAINGDCSKIRFVRGIELLMMDSTLVSQYALDVMSLNIKLAPTYFKDFQFHEINNDFWNELAMEYRDARNLHPLRIVIDGPPLVGKTEHAQRLAEYYQLLYVDIRKIVNTYIRYLEQKIADSIIVVDSFECPSQTNFECEDEGDEEEILAKRASSEIKGEGGSIEQKFDPDDEYLLEELKYRIERWSSELFKLKVYLASHKTYPEWDFEHISRCLISLLSTKSYNDNQGYVLDGFPFNFEEASEIFYNTRKIYLPIVEELEEGQDPTAGVFIPPPPLPLTPTHFVMLDATDDLLRKRAMGLSETEATLRRCLRHQMIPRLDAHRLRNEEPFCLANIFYDNQLIPINIFVEPTTFLADTVRTLKSEIGQPFIYPPTEEEQIVIDKALAEKRAKEEEEQRRKKDELIRTLTLERERKLLEWNKKYEDIRKHENELREIKTLPLRQYLGKYILPTLTEGILKVAEVKPDDPVDFLSDYLFRCNPEGQQMPPFCSNEQRKRFFNTFYEDLSSDSDYFFERDNVRK